MELKFTLETEDITGDEYGCDFDTIFTDEVKRAIVEDARKQVKTEKFDQFAELASKTIVDDIKLRMQNFLDEEIALTQGYGEKTFVGSIEDLIKQRFDDILLRPVDNNGKTLQGCTSSGRTWIEWMLSDKLDRFVSNEVKSAKKSIEYTIKKQVNEKIEEMKNGAIKDKVNDVFGELLSKKITP